MQNLSRRAALGAFTAAAGLAAVPISAAAAKIGTTDRTAWDRAFKVMQKAQAAYEADFRYYLPMHDRCNRATEAVPHVTLRPDPYSGRLQPVTTADTGFVHESRRMVKEVAEGRRWLETEKYASLKQHFELCKDVAAAADARDAEIRRIQEGYGYWPATERNEALCSAMCDAEDALIEMPAPDNEALLWKLDHLFGPDARSADGNSASWARDYIDVVVADARPLLSNGRA